MPLLSYLADTNVISAWMARQEPVMDWLRKHRAGTAISILRYSQPLRQVQSSSPCFCTTRASRRSRPRTSVWRSRLLSA